MKTREGKPWGYDEKGFPRIYVPWLLEEWVVWSGVAHFVKARLCCCDLLGHDLFFFGRHVVSVSDSSSCNAYKRVVQTQLTKTKRSALQHSISGFSLNFTYLKSPLGTEYPYLPHPHGLISISGHRCMQIKWT